MLEESGTESLQGSMKTGTPLKRLDFSVIAVVLGGLMWVAFYSIAILQMDWESLPSTVSVPLLVSLVGSIVFVVGVILSLLLLRRLVG
jgi:hypothetical protein